MDVELVKGDAGEFSVWVDGNCVARKKFLFYPRDSTVLAKVREALSKKLAL